MGLLLEHAQYLHNYIYGLKKKSKKICQAPCMPRQRALSSSATAESSFEAATGKGVGDTTRT